MHHLVVLILEARSDGPKLFLESVVCVPVLTDTGFAKGVRDGYGGLVLHIVFLCSIVLQEHRAPLNVVSHRLPRLASSFLNFLCSGPKREVEKRMSLKKQ